MHTHTYMYTVYLTIPVLAVSAIRLSSSAGNSSLWSLMHPVRRRGRVGIAVHRIRYWCALVRMDVNKSLRLIVEPYH